MAEAGFDPRHYNTRCRFSALWKQRGLRTPLLRRSGYQIWTGVQDFADPCLTTRPTHQTRKHSHKNASRCSQSYHHQESNPEYALRTSMCCSLHYGGISSLFIIDIFCQLQKKIYGAHGGTRTPNGLSAPSRSVAGCSIQLNYMGIDKCVY